MVAMHINNVYFFMLPTGLIWYHMIHDMVHMAPLNTLRPRQNGRRFAEDTFKRIFLNENVLISYKISLKFIPKEDTNNYSPIC